MSRNKNGHFQSEEGLAQLKKKAEGERMPFLTELDERAELKGSRDPLGLVPIWSTLGRQVVGNLTTVTASGRAFTTLLLGLELANMLREQMRSEAGDLLDTFLRFEQLAGYARIKLSHSDREVRGFRRISRRLNEGRRIRVSAVLKTRSSQIRKYMAYGVCLRFLRARVGCWRLESLSSRPRREALSKRTTFRCSATVRV